MPLHQFHELYLLPLLVFWTTAVMWCVCACDWGECIKNLDKNLKTRCFDHNLFSLVFVFLHSDSTDPEADDSDDQTAWDSVSSLQRRAPLPSLKEGGKPEEHSPELRGLGVRRGASSWPLQVFWGHILALHRQMDVFSKQDNVMSSGEKDTCQNIPPKTFL